MELTDAQAKGVDWILAHWKKNDGGILADQQGFGKTAQAVVSIRKYKKRALVLAPLSVLYQWKEAFARWGYAQPVHVYHQGPWVDAMVVITTYETYRRHEVWKKQKWRVAVLDEGAKIKNADTAIFKAVANLRTRRRLILSATPLQNDVKELYNLVSCVAPGLLGDAETFDSHFTRPLREASRRNATTTTILYGRQCGKVLADKVAPYLLRRHQQMAPMKQDVCYCDLETSPALKRLYARVCHEHRRANTKAQRFKRELDLRSIVSGTHPEAREMNIPKLDALRELVSQQPGERFAIFVKHLATLAVVKAVLGLSTSQCIDGTVSAKNRKVYIDAFGNDESVRVLAMTARTGGVGINLPGATRIVLFEPDFNPTVDDQAAFRSHRRGQTKSIVVYRLITKGTLEEAILRRQLEKTKESTMAMPTSVLIGSDITETAEDLVSTTLFKRVSYTRMVEDYHVRMFPTSTIRRNFEADIESKNRGRKRQQKREKKERRLPAKITKFLAGAGGVLATEEIIAAFRGYVKKHQIDARVFKHALRRVARYEPSLRVWKLRAWDHL